VPCLTAIGTQERHHDCFDPRYRDPRRSATAPDLRTEIGELSVAREAFAGMPAGEHEGDFVIRRLYLKAATGDSYVLVLPWAELERHRLASAQARGPTPD